MQGFGTTSELHEYLYLDDLTSVTASKVIYRLKQINFDGSFTYIKNEVAIEFSPISFELHQNYPNPFNPGTVINWQVPVNGFVSLKVYDMLGNEIAVLVNEEKAAGGYQTEFNASNLSSGTYFYRLEAGSFVQTKKMIFLK